MALEALYKRFLAAPSSSALAENASLHYVTTTTSFTGAADIVKHLFSVRNKIKKKQEDVLFAIENPDVVVVEAETTLEFLTSGGPYLPGMDDNFIADRTVHLPIIHIVTFDGERKIAQIRQSWDQGSLLKQVDVMGRTGQNWPIRDSKEQISLIAKCVKNLGVPAAPAEGLPTRTRGGSTNILRDPHSSLDLFARRDESRDEPTGIISPYAGTRPRQRTLTEIIGDDHVEEPGSPSAGRDTHRSPSKANAKAGAGKHFQPMRLFDTDEGDAAPETHHKSPERPIRPNPKKYQHLDLDDGSQPQEAPAPKPVTDAAANRIKSDSSWSFEDFVTPQKPVVQRALHRARDVCHFGADNDVLANTPAPNAQVLKPRRDAEAHFELADDGPRVQDARDTGRMPRGAAQNQGLHLYDNRLHTEDGAIPSPGPLPLGNVTNLKSRDKTFEAHFGMGGQPGADDAEPAKVVGEDRKKAVRMMESNWSTYDISPVSHKENNNPNSTQAGDDRGISIGGDGMGGKKGSSRGWMTGEGDEEDTVPGKQQGRGPPTRSDFWDY
ncbi:hypothetical protein BT67DRAFT_439424 [Trichocladium antarcticum]|uniref:Uncharacterized protein n=1 Tax=Trichocladium antarcticum TaxID=1450529 RepID=A0AAN6UP90_9PEZI|nr:hypothetical protein BT67DRAFT_439424 [Trichocladium antarcticum]